MPADFSFGDFEMGTKGSSFLCLFCLLIGGLPLLRASEPQPGDYIFTISSAELEEELENTDAARISKVFLSFELPHARVEEIRDDKIVIGGACVEKSAVLIPQDVINKLGLKAESDPGNASNWFKRGIVHASCAAFLSGPAVGLLSFI